MAAFTVRGLGWQPTQASACAWFPASQMVGTCRPQLGSGLLYGPNLPSDSGLVCKDESMKFTTYANVILPGELGDFKKEVRSVADSTEATGSYRIATGDGTAVQLAGETRCKSYEHVLVAEMQIPLFFVGLHDVQLLDEAASKTMAASSFSEKYGNTIVSAVCLGAYIKSTVHCRDSSYYASQTTQTDADAVKVESTICVKREVSFSIRSGRVPASLREGEHTCTYEGGSSATPESILQGMLETFAAKQKAEWHGKKAQDIIMKSGLDILCVGVAYYPHREYGGAGLRKLNMEQLVMTADIIRRFNDSYAKDMLADQRKAARELEWTKSYILCLNDSFVGVETPLRLPGVPHRDMSLQNSLARSITIQIRPSMWMLGWSDWIPLAPNSSVTGLVEFWWYDIYVKTGGPLPVRVAQGVRLHNKNWRMVAVQNEIKLQAALD